MKTILHINGMMCCMCESHINDAIRKNFTVKKVKSSKRKNQTVIVADEILDEEKIRQVIKETGYELVGIEKK
ncbi:MAG: hypothetical protein MJ184_10675 [Treponema sp.]|uniref:heavy-metal-associated domain-containing protein n=1 Tax=Treponema sp. TaxID=166 RepID=UPI00298DBF15|nr:hypothetical protein [Treponema sp.]MCQ2601811.1 hypothetical protein [Treponema sp.]